MTEQLKPCPCGEVPTELDCDPVDVTKRYGYVWGTCCMEWTIRFRLPKNASAESKKVMELAVQAWNSAPRSKE